MADDLRANALVNDSLGSALRSGDHALGTVPGLLKKVLADGGTWRDFITKRGEEVHHDRFADFVEAKPLRGLGADVPLIERIVAADDDATKMLREALKEKPGPKSSHNNVMRTKQGNGRSYALQRLEDEAPELHEEVIAGRLSAHGAMVQAGFRPKTVSVPVTKPEAVAKSLLKYMKPDDIAQLITLLLGKEA